MKAYIKNGSQTPTIDRRRHKLFLHTLFEYPLGKPLGAKVLKGLLRNACLNTFRSREGISYFWRLVNSRFGGKDVCYLVSSSRCVSMAVVNGGCYLGDLAISGI